MTTIHRYWSPAPFPEWAVDNGREWTRTAGVEPSDWTDATLPPQVLSDLEPLLEANDDPRHRANLARLSLLFHFGGLWADCDARPVRSILWLLGERPWVVESRRSRAPSTSLMWFPRPNHPLLKEVLNNVKPHERVTLASGARLLRELIASHDDVGVIPYGIVDASPGRVMGMTLVTHEYRTGKDR